MEDPAVIYVRECFLFFVFFFQITRTNNLTIFMEIQETLNSQSSLEKEEWNWWDQPA